MRKSARCAVFTDRVQIARLLPQPQDRQKLKTAVREMKARSPRLSVHF
jgi:hypothetical protein